MGLHEPGYLPYESNKSSLTSPPPFSHPLSLPLPNSQWSPEVGRRGYETAQASAKMDRAYVSPEIQAQETAEGKGITGSKKVTCKYSLHTTHTNIALGLVAAGDASRTERSVDSLAARDAEGKGGTHLRGHTLGSMGSWSVLSVRQAG